MEILKRIQDFTKLLATDIHLINQLEDGEIYSDLKIARKELAMKHLLAVKAIIAELENILK